MNFNSRLLWTIERQLLSRLLFMLRIIQKKLWKQMKVVVTDSLLLREKKIFMIQFSLEICRYFIAENFYTVMEIVCIDSTCMPGKNYNAIS